MNCLSEGFWFQIGRDTAEVVVGAAVLVVCIGIALFINWPRKAK